eukprot:gene11621-15561_t
MLAGISAVKLRRSSHLAAAKREEHQQNFMAPNALIEKNRFDEFCSTVTEVMRLRKGGKLRYASNNKSDASTEVEEATNKSLLALNLIQARNVKNQSWIIPPYHPAKIVWDIIVAFFVVYSMIVVPWKVATNYETKDGIILYVLDQVTIGIFGLDIIFNFRTAYMDEKNDILITSWRKIARNYISFWFWLDIISTIPFSSIATSLHGNRSVVDFLRQLRILRVLRLYKLFNSTTFYKGLDKMSIDPLLVNLAFLLIEIGYFAHLVACLWLWLGHRGAMSREKLNSETDPYPVEYTWLMVFQGENQFLIDSSFIEQYITAIYWTIITMLTIGFGDIHATNNAERIFSIFTMLSGGVIFGALISQVTKLLENRNPQARAMKEKLDELRSYLDGFDIPFDLKIRAKSSYEYFLTKKSSLTESEVFNQLPKKMLMKLVFKLYKDDIELISLFKTADKDFVLPLIINSRPMEANKREIIVNYGDVCSDIFFITSGIVRLFTHDGIHKIIVGYAKEGNFFGDIEYHKNCLAVVSYEAASNCHILAVSYQTINNAILESSEEGYKFQNDLKLRYDNYLKVLRSGVVSRDPVASNEISVSEKGSLHVASIHRNNRLKPRKRRSGLIINLRSSSLSDSSKHITPHSERKNHKLLLLNGKSFLAAEGSVHFFQLHRNIEDDDNDNNDPIDGLGLYENDISKCHPVIILNDSRSYTSQPETILEELSIQDMREMWLIHPRDEYKVCWDLLITLVIVITVLLLPVEIVFAKAQTQESKKFNIILTVFFLIDTALNFRTGYYDPVAHRMVMVPKMIALKYLKKWFIFDILACIPFGEFKWHGFESLKLLRVLRLLRLLRLVETVVFVRFIRKFEDATGLSGKIFEILKIIFEVFLVAHLTACVIWGLSHNFQSTHHWYDKGVTIGTNPLDETLFPTDYQSIITEGFQNKVLSSQYLVTLYLTFTTLTTVGYGDIVPTNTNERILILFVAIVGASTFGYIISNVSSLMDQVNMIKTQSNTKISVIFQYLKEKKCPKEFSNYIIDHFKQLYKDSSSSAFDQMEILARFPPNIRNQILFHQYKNKMAIICIFNYIDNQSVCLYLFKLMDVAYFGPGDWVIKQHEESLGVSFVVSGALRSYKRLSKTKNKNQHKSNSLKRKQSLFLGVLRETSVLKMFGSNKISKVKSTTSNGIDEMEPYLIDDLEANLYEDAIRSKTRVEEYNINMPWNIIPEQIRLPNYDYFNMFSSSNRRGTEKIIADYGVKDEFNKYNNDDKNNDNNKIQVGKDESSELNKSHSSKNNNNNNKTQNMNLSDRSSKFKKSHSLGSDNYSSKTQYGTDSVGSSNFKKSYSSNSNRTQNGNYGSDRNAKFKKFHSLNSFNSLNLSQVFSHHKPQTFSELSVSDMLKRKDLQYLSDLYPGTFFGHVDMKEKKTVNTASVRALMFSSVYTLNRADIRKIIRTEPAVGLLLQNSLALASLQQLDNVGKPTMRQLRSIFVREQVHDLKNKLEKRNLDRKLDYQRFLDKHALEMNYALNSPAKPQPMKHMTLQELSQIFEKQNGHILQAARHSLSQEDESIGLHSPSREKSEIKLNNNNNTNNNIIKMDNLYCNDNDAIKDNDDCKSSDDSDNGLILPYDVDKDIFDMKKTPSLLATTKSIHQIDISDYSANSNDNTTVYPIFQANQHSNSFIKTNDENDCNHNNSNPSNNIIDNNNNNETVHNIKKISSGKKVEIDVDLTTSSKQAHQHQQESPPTSYLTGYWTNNNSTEEKISKLSKLLKIMEKENAFDSDDESKESQRMKSSYFSLLPISRKRSIFGKSSSFFLQNNFIIQNMISSHSKLSTTSYDSNNIEAFSIRKTPSCSDLDIIFEKYLNHNNHYHRDSSHEKYQMISHNNNENKVDVIQTYPGLNKDDLIHKHQDNRSKSYNKSDITRLAPRAGAQQHDPKSDPFAKKQQTRPRRLSYPSIEVEDWREFLIEQPMF